MPPRFFLLIALFLILPFAVAAEDVEVSHVVSEIVINVEGNTKVPAIKKFIDIQENDKFPSEDELLRIAERERQDLVNYRVFHEVTMKAELIGEENGRVLWRITYGVRDSWTILPIFYPKYDSNTGFRIGLKTFYDNAFGTMTDLYLGLGMNIGPNRSTGEWEVGEWNINPRWEGIRIGSLLVSGSYLQAYEQQQFDSGVPSTEFHYGYNMSVISLKSSIPILDSGLDYGFSVAFNMKYGYRSYLKTMNYRREPFSFGWIHSVSYGRVDWKENFRDGQLVSINHNIGLVADPTDRNYFIVNGLSLIGSFYRPFGTIFNYYGRAVAFVSFNSQRSGVAENLRGVANNAMSGDWGFYLNNSIGIQFWRLEGVWDAQVHPFFDIGLASPYGAKNLEQDLRFGAGLDFVLYLDILPNLVLRGMIGADLSRYSWNDLRKYEITISSSLYH